MKKNNNILVLVLIAVLFSGVGFFGGTTYQKSKTPAIEYSNPFAGNRNGRTGTVQTGAQGGTQKRIMSNGQIIGEITSVSDTSITVKTTDGSSKLILISDKTSINKASSAAVADLKVGEKVAAFGTTNTDGSVTGQNIQLNPVDRPRPDVSLTPAK